MRKLTYQEWVRGVNVWTPCITAGFLAYCLLTPKSWFAFLFLKISGENVKEWWLAGWQDSYRILSAIGALICTLCIHLLLLSRTKISERENSVSRAEFISFLVFSFAIISFNLAVYPILRHNWWVHHEQIKHLIYVVVYQIIIIGYTLAAVFLFKLKLKDIGLGKERMVLNIFFALCIGIGGGLFTATFNCGGTPDITAKSIISIFRWSILDAFAFVIFCFGYSTGLLYTKHKAFGIFFIVPLLYSFVWHYISPANSVFVFGFGILFSLCVYKTGTFLFPLLLNFSANFLHMLAPWRIAGFTNYFLLPASAIFLFITIYIWHREYKQIIKAGETNYRMAEQIPESETGVNDKEQNEKQ